MTLPKTATNWLVASNYKLPRRQPKASVNKDLAKKVFKAPGSRAASKVVAGHRPGSAKNRTAVG